MSAIKAGDLVMVVRVHCVDDGSLGRIFHVDKIDTGPMWCPLCHREVSVSDRHWVPGLDNAAFPASYLKRIPPLNALDNMTKDAGITA